MPSPIVLDEKQQEDEAVFEQEMAKVRRTWKSLGFKPFGKDARLFLFGGAGFSDALKQRAATDPSVQLIGLDRLYYGS